MDEAAEQAAPTPLDPAAGAALIGVVATLSGELLVDDPPDLADRLRRRLDRDGFDPEAPLTERLGHLVEHLRWSIGERPPGVSAP